MPCDPLTPPQSGDLREECGNPALHYSVTEEPRLAVSFSFGATTSPVVPALVDTGAQTSILPRYIADSLNLPRKPVSGPAQALGTTIDIDEVDWDAPNNPQDLYCNLRVSGKLWRIPIDPRILRNDDPGRHPYWDAALGLLDFLACFAEVQFKFMPDGTGTIQFIGGDRPHPLCASSQATGSGFARPASPSSTAEPTS